MKFLIQHNMLNPTELEKIRKAVESYPTVFCGVIPFSRDITGIEDEENQTEFIPYGSTLMTTIGHDVGKWTGLHFDLTKFNYEQAIANRDDMLNTNVIRLDEAIQILESEVLDNPYKLFFTRPSEDLKQFSGQVIGAEECLSWFKSMLECETSGSYKLEPETKVVLCEPQNIQAEWRWFIVGGKVVSGSMYRWCGQLRKHRVTETEMIDEAQSFADKWLPDDCCVMDLALVDDELKVIEFNCINASGLYANDIPAVFKALWEYHQ